MEPTKTPPPVAGEVMTGLTIVYCGARMFVGKLDEAEHKGELPEVGYTIVLNDALEVLAPVVPTPQGPARSIQLLPIFPTRGPVRTTIQVDHIYDVGHDSHMVQAYSAVTGNRGILIPGFG